jgi:hypothetical protein
MASGQIVTVSTGFSRRVDRFARLGFCAPEDWGRGPWGNRIMREIELGKRVLMSEDREEMSKLLRGLGYLA